MNNNEIVINAIKHITADDLLKYMTPTEIDDLAAVAANALKTLRKEERWAKNLRAAKALAKSAYGRRCY